MAEFNIYKPFCCKQSVKTRESVKPRFDDWRLIYPYRMHRFAHFSLRMVFQTLFYYNQEDEIKRGLVRSDYNPQTWSISVYISHFVVNVRRKPENLLNHDSTADGWFTHTGCTVLHTCLCAWFFKPCFMTIRKMKFILISTKLGSLWLKSTNMAEFNIYKPFCCKRSAKTRESAKLRFDDWRLIYPYTMHRFSHFSLHLTFQTLFYDNLGDRIYFNFNEALFTVI